MADVEGLAQSAVERFIENEALRGALNDEGFLPLTNWATNALIAAAQEAATASDERAEARMEEAEAAVKRIVRAVVHAAEQHTRADVAALAKDPNIVRNIGARLRLLAYSWRLGDDVDANAIRLTQALQGVKV